MSERRLFGAPIPAAAVAAEPQRIASPRGLRSVYRWIRDVARQLGRGIPSEKYTREYFLSDRCDGFHEFLNSRGLSFVKERLVECVDPRQGERLLEIGCGRGEVLRACVERGARAAGLDYSRDAVRLTRETCERRAPTLLGDAARLPFAAASFDKVLLGDVLEHLTPEQAENMLVEVHRVLEPGGTLILHTSPNVFFMHLILPCLIPVLWLLGRRELAGRLLRQYRASWEYHVREYSPGRLETLFESSPFVAAEVRGDPDLLRGGRSEYTASIAANPAVRVLARWMSRGPLLRILANDLWVIARKAL